MSEKRNFSYDELEYYATHLGEIRKYSEAEINSDDSVGDPTYLKGEKSNQNSVSDGEDALYSHSYIQFDKEEEDGDFMSIFFHRNTMNIKFIFMTWDFWIFTNYF